MRLDIISCLLISLFIHELGMVDKSSSSICVEARSGLSRFSNDELLFNSRDKVDAGGLKNLDRNNGGGRVPTPSPPNPNMRIRWKPIFPSPSQSPPPPASSDASYPP
ncbi:hypothetical protein HAX54_035639 [Datura stramonium]|uniref:Uncharacterized protein n=1 Tax=Datura stramonium TaxID=4076 RepID=A0ABS8SFG6_DATST|nr:hypothetical protein [Datura stramonium]